MKIDDADWHMGDAANEVQASMHIALVYYWLLNRGFIRKEFVPKEQIIIMEQENVLPGELFIAYADGKLFTDHIKAEAAEFLSGFYQNEYLPDIQNDSIPDLIYDIRYATPYNIRDIWENIEISAKYLDQAYGIKK